MNKNKLLLWSIVAALAGFIFGFDTVVISGANEPIKALWHTSPLFHGFFIMSMALWGTVIGAFVGSFVGLAAFGGAIAGTIPGAILGWYIAAQRSSNR